VVFKSSEPNIKRQILNLKHPLIGCLKLIDVLICSDVYLFTELFNIYPAIRSSMEKMSLLAFLPQNKATA